MSQPFTPEVIYLMREASGMGMMECKLAAEDAIAHFDGDFVFALLVKSASSLAVSVRSKDPNVSDKDARRKWNINHAKSSKIGIVDRSDAWKRLTQMSGDYQV